MAETLNQLLSDATRLQSAAREAMGDRERLSPGEFSDCLYQVCKRLKVSTPTDLLQTATEEATGEMTAEQWTTALRKFLERVAERQARSSGTPAMPVMMAARKAQKSRSQNHTPLRANPRSLPLPSYPVSVAVFYQDGRGSQVWSERPDQHCQVQSERSNLAQYNLVLRRFPELQRNLRRSMDFERTKPISPGKEPRYRASTERHSTQQRTIVNSPGKSDYRAPKAFIPANSSEARDKLDRAVHGFQGSPYEAKRMDDYAEFLRSKDMRVGSNFKPAYFSEQLMDRSLYLNSKLTTEAFAQKTSSKRVTHSQTFYP